MPFHIGSLVGAMICLTLILPGLSQDPWELNSIHKKIDEPADPEPWKLNPVHTKKTDESVKPKRNQNTQKTDSFVNKCEGAYFYKRLLKLLTRQIAEDADKRNEDIDADINLKFSSSDYRIIKEYFLSTEELTPSQYRRIDGILSDSILGESYVKKTFAFYLQNYYLHAIYVVAAIFCLYWIYSTSWTSFFTTRTACFIFFLFCCAYEGMIAIQEVEAKYDNEFLESLKPCLYMFWKVECDPRRSEVSHYWTHLHPLTILGKLSSRSMISTLGTVEYISKHLSNYCPYGFQNLSYMGFYFILIALGALFLMTISLNIFWNTPISFYGLNLKQKRSESYIHESHSRERPIENGNSLSGENLSNFLKLFSNGLKSSGSTNNRRIPSTNKLKKKKDTAHKKICSS